MNTGDVRDRNGSRIALEPATEFLVLARLEAGAVSRVRTFTPDCDIDATAHAAGLADRRQAGREHRLAGVARRRGAGRRRAARSRRQDGDERHRAAQRRRRPIARSKASSRRRSPEWLRGDTAFWLGSARGEAGARLLARMIAQDPSDKVREKVDLRPLGQQGAGGADHAHRDRARRQEHEGPRPGAVLAGAEGRQGSGRASSPARSTTTRTPR